MFARSFRQYFPIENVSPYIQNLASCVFPVVTQIGVFLSTQVTMPPGVLPGHTVNFGGKGMEHPDKLPGSVRVVAVQQPHPRFERQGEAGFEGHGGEV